MLYPTIPLILYQYFIPYFISNWYNSKIQVSKSSARGFRNPKNWRISILFHMGKLHLSPYPQLSKPFDEDPNLCRALGCAKFAPEK
jgi:hypothetical protein